MEGYIRGAFVTEWKEGGILVGARTRVEIIALAVGGDARSLVRLPTGETVRIPNESLLGLR